jgi:transposase
MEVLHPRCCGIDVHKDTLVACLRVQDGRRSRKEVQSFGTTSAEVIRLQAWLTQAACTHVAMESTGVYWQPVFNVLEGTLTVVLANAHHIKAVPGRKTDVRDCEWLAELLAHGLIRASFIPPANIRALRDLTRHRKRLIRDRATNTNRIHKLLETAHLKLASVISDILGVSGRAILRALADGETDPTRLAHLGRARLARKTETLTEALRGRFTADHAFLLSQLLAQLDHLTALIAACDVEVTRLTQPIAAHVDRLQTIVGVGARAAQVIVSEIGTDMTRFASSAHLASWARLCPGTHESAGKRRPTGTGPGNNWLRTTLLESAWAASHSRASYLRAKYQRITKRRGAKRAAIAVAHTILVIAFHVWREEVPFRDLGADYFDRLDVARQKQYHLRRLAALGCDISQVNA